MGCHPNLHFDWWGNDCWRDLSCSVDVTRLPSHPRGNYKRRTNSAGMRKRGALVAERQGRPPWLPPVRETEKGRAWKIEILNLKLPGSQSRAQLSFRVGGNFKNKFNSDYLPWLLIPVGHWFGNGGCSGLPSRRIKWRRPWWEWGWRRRRGVNSLECGIVSGFCQKF